LFDKLDELDKKTEFSQLNDDELNLKHTLNEKLAQLLREEEIKWCQRAKVRNLLEGDANTKYFQLVANGKHRKTRIFQLEQEEGIIICDACLKMFITKYYTNLFSSPEPSFVTMDETRIDDIPQVTKVENETLTQSFSEAKVKDAIFQMKHNSATVPDGFPLEFYQAFWNIIKGDLMALFEEFHKGDLPLQWLNFGTIILLPKSSDAKQIQQYRPIQVVMLNKSNNTDRSVC